jgi:hypothetical protein
MKRLLVVMIVLACFSGSALAEGMTYGIKAGVNLADFSGDIEHNERKLGFSGGLFLNYAFTEIFSVQPELLFMMRGTKHEQLENTAYHLTYFEVPVLVKLSLPTGAAFLPHAFVGPSFGFLIDATEEYANIENDIKDYINSVDYGMVIGTGFDYMIGAGRLLFDARYSFSLANILEEEENEDDDELKNSGITIMVGYGYTF